jgi:Fe-S oxidoreductase
MLAATAPGVVNAVARAPLVGRLGKRLAGIDPHREPPPFAPTTFRAWFRTHTPAGTGERGAVVLWPDTFTNHFHPGIGRAAVHVLEAAGWAVRIPDRAACCGLTWISTGQLRTARRVIRRTVEVLRPELQRGALVVGLEPSCTAVFRSDAPELFHLDPDVERLRRQTVTLAELLHDHTPEWRPPRLGVHALVQTHCHHHAIMRTAADTALLADVGVDADFLDAGCCGLAGNFGFERGHYEVSEACAERALLPAIRAAAETDVILADGFSCRTQIDQGKANGRRALHLAELLAAAVDGRPPRGRAEQAWAERPAPPSAPARAAAGAVTLASAAAAARVAAGRPHR